MVDTNDVVSELRQIRELLQYLTEVVEGLEHR